MIAEEGLRTALWHRGARQVVGCLSFLLAFSLAPAQGPDVAAASAVSTDPGEGEQLGNYRIGIEDVLRIHVWEDQDLRGGLALVVGPDGWITVPYAGEIQAVGLTRAELRSTITQRIEPFIPEATITVTVEQVNSFKFYVLGNVNSQGMYSVGSRLHLLQAIAYAGGLSEFADKDDILVIRDVNGKQVSYRFNYKKIIAGEEDENPWIRPGDTIVVR